MLAGAVLGLKVTIQKMYANLGYTLRLIHSHFLPLDGR